MAQVRRYCDAIVVGASTFRAERYRPQRPPSQIQQERQTLGLHPAPRLVLVSLSLDLPWEEAAFRESTVAPLVVTAGTCEPAALQAARRHAEVAVLPGARVDVADLIRSLEDRGLNRVLCEGGPHLLAQLAGAGVLDELDLAVSPLMGGGGQIVLGEPDLAPARFHLVQVLTAEGFLFTRYLRDEPGAEPLKGSA
jgi:riboflavin biosynthesis pyrimidine reductase